MKSAKWSQRLRSTLTILTLALLGFQSRESSAQPAPPDDPQKISWLTAIPFDDTNWINSTYYTPISFANLVNVEQGGDGNALLLDDTNAPAWLQYRIIENDGSTNLLLNQGTLTLWIYPSWLGTNQGGTGPVQWGRLVEVGSYTTNASYGWWSLYFNGEGTQIYFGGQSNDGSQAAYLSAPINWSSNSWHMLALTYCATNSSLYVDGLAVVTNGTGVAYWPPADVQTNGFFIGSDHTGVAQARGMLDDFFVFNYPLDAYQIADMFVVYSIAYFPEPKNLGKVLSAPSYPTNSPIFTAINGSGNLTNAVTNLLTCVISTNIWLTNVVAAMATNGTVSVTFTIAGGSNGVPYDVFANSILIFSTNTNTAWGWMGQGYQCVTYTLPNLTNSSCFLMLGKPQDSDADGLTDAYELLVSKTNPQTADTSGDGMLDGWKALWGLDALSNNVLQGGRRANYTYDPAGWLKQLSGLRQETMDPDAEGNLLNDSQ